MTKRDFIELSEKTFNDIEQLVDDQYPDVDFDREGNVLTLTLERTTLFHTLPYRATKKALKMAVLCAFPSVL